MKKHEEYNISFEKIITSSKRIWHVANPKIHTPAAWYISQLLDKMNNIYEPQGLIEEIDLALNNEPFDPYFGINGSFAPNDCTIVPPNAIIGDNNFSFPLTELKIILQEWLEFLET